MSIPSDVPAGMMSTGYFKDPYDSFYDFIRQENGRELFYGIEVVHHSETDSYYMLTNDPTMAAAREESQRNSNIMNALSSIARELAQKEMGSSYFTIGEEAGKRIKPLF